MSFESHMESQVAQMGQGLILTAIHANQMSNERARTQDMARAVGIYRQSAHQHAADCARLRSQVEDAAETIRLLRAQITADARALAIARRESEMLIDELMSCAGQRDAALAASQQAAA